MTERDPRQDPLPGDVFMIGPQWQSERYEILGVGTNIVHYRMSEALLSASLRDFRDWAKHADVLETSRNAEQQSKCKQMEPATTPVKSHEGAKR